VAFQERQAMTTHQGPGNQVACTKVASGTCIVDRSPESPFKLLR
jgi:hypothetical protein